MNRLIALVIAAALTGCATNPATGATTIDLAKVVGVAGAIAAGCWQSDDCRCTVLRMDCPDAPSPVPVVPSPVPSVAPVRPGAGTTPSPGPGPGETDGDGPVVAPSIGSPIGQGRLSMRIRGADGVSPTMAIFFLMQGNTLAGHEQNIHIGMYTDQIRVNRHFFGPGGRDGILAKFSAAPKINFEPNEEYTLDCNWNLTRFWCEIQGRTLTVPLESSFVRLTQFRYGNASYDRRKIGPDAEVVLTSFVSE